MNIQDYLDNPLSDPLTARFYPEEPRLRNLLLIHSQCVARMAIDIAENFVANHSDVNLDMEFIARAAMLHDIGIEACDAPGIFCFGSLPYICHGVEGSRILAEEGLIRYALVCERHTGSGLTADEIAEEALPLPQRDMLPLSDEEKIICLADKFFSKNPDSLTHKKSIEQIRNSISRYGQQPLARLDALIARYITQTS